MNISDIEKAVNELSSRHTGLTEEFLRTLLEASGWEEKYIQEALVVFKVGTAREKEDKKSKTGELIATQDKNTLTFLKPDGTEEGPLPSFENTEDQVHVRAKDETKKESTSLTQDFFQEEQKNLKESVSLVEHNEKNNTKKKVFEELPDNLPLIPFESSPHVWSFSKYKDVFDTAGTIQQENKKEESVAPKEGLVTHVVSTNPPVVSKYQQETVIEKKVTKGEVSNSADPNMQPHKEEVDFEKTPMSLGDESLIVLASIMLLAIMLILGYMYSNGRL